ncbi:hypothetical protein FAZ19_23020 [Sphingobacterium alkalisoli]|uniref:Phosphoenolpyruvate carboxykinase n=1 Tax=Sphingobacterium alkalisoli TaxID=1874115 RepID=A0A4U0GN33_9SPHI|nr:hypothetical protein [Sphingobacterium alkalisoli]TJY60127.1 hypothetical protein FAZ19_23020 [Sphingobacterium alkalisoli]GGH32078.1 hypothetical protein GCM10011418_45370 [Sphingobacterium alkalisoli]
MKEDLIYEDTVLQDVYYRIAGHTLKVSMPEVDTDRVLPSFTDFSIRCATADDPISRIVISTGPSFVDLTKATLRSDVSVTWGDRFRFYETENHYITRVMNENASAYWEMVSAKDFSESRIYAMEVSLLDSTVLSWLLMVTFGQAALLHNTILIHASVVEKDGRGYAFLGKSGTGKSTHSNLWIAHIPGTTLLNDDNPAIRVEDDGIRVYGTPWSGKTPCYRNVGVKLQALVRLRQAPVNQLQLQKGKLALLTVLPSCTALRWNQTLYTAMMDMLVWLLPDVRVAQMDCLPNADAAKICYKQIGNN